MQKMIKTKDGVLRAPSYIEIAAENLYNSIDEVTRSYPHLSVPEERIIKLIEAALNEVAQQARDEALSEVEKELLEIEHCSGQCLYTVRALKGEK